MLLDAILAGARCSHTHQQGLSAVLLCPTVDVPHAWGPPDFGRPIRRAGRLTRSTLHPAVQLQDRVFLNTMRCSLRTGKEFPCVPPPPSCPCGPLLGFPSDFPSLWPCSVSPRTLVFPGPCAREEARARRGGGRTPRGGLCALRLGLCALRLGTPAVLPLHHQHGSDFGLLWGTALSSRRLRPGCTCVGTGLVFARP